MILNDIWDSSNIQNTIKEQFNLIMTGINIKPVTVEESISIETIIKNYCHVLLRQQLKYADSDELVATLMLGECVTHNIHRLVLEYRLAMEAFSYEEKGKTVTQLSNQPFDNTEDKANSIYAQTSQFTTLDNMIKTMEFMKLNSNYIRDIYQEVRSMVIMLGEGS